MEDDAEIAPEIELTISNWDTLFGEEGIVKTPLGEVKMGENQFAKLMRQGRESKLGMIKPTLENPDVIIEASSEAKEGSITERGSSYIFVKAFRKSDGSRYYYFTSVTVSKEGKEVVVSSQEKSRNRLLRLLTDEEIIWRTPKDATTSSAERQGLDYVQPLDAETATKGSGLTPQRISSADKVTESSEEWQEQEEKFSPTPSGNTGGEEGTYTLSSKTSENGESFYQNNDGNIDLADIPDEVFDKIGKPKAPFRLTPSMLKHVFDRHGKEMGLHHADDAIDFVLDVLNNFDHVRQGDKGAIIFSIENGRSRTGRRAVTILLDSQRGEYYGIKTSGYERIEGLHKRPLLWEKGAKETSATGVAPANVTTNETQQGNELTGSASNHGNDPMGKVTESSEELQGKEKNFTPAPIEDGEVQSPSEKYQPIIQATFNKVKREQGIIEPIAEKKRKPFTVFDVTVKEPRRPMFEGVYHDGGMAVATNGVVMFAHKEAYDEAKEGKIITSKGDVIEGKFPDWRGAIPKETIPTGLQTEPLLEFVNGALARMKAEKAKKYEVDGALAYIKFQDGNVVCCQLVDLQKMLRAAKSIGADDLRFGTDKEFLVAESPAGKAIVIIQDEEKARYNAGYNNFAYEAPTVKGEEEVSDGALDNPYPSEKEVEGFSNLIRNIFDTIEESKDDNTGNVVLKQFSNVLLSADTESQRLATDAALEGLKRAGVPVEVVSDEQAAAMLGEQKGVELSAKQKRALETASPAMQDHSTVVSSADGTKVLKDLDNTIEEDLKITDHVQFMKTPSGTLYGWTVGGKIYLTKDGLNPNTPIHEYTHLWARAMKERNKEGWQSVKELLRDTPVWDEVLKDKNYQDILDDEDAVASEALSRISGKKNAEKMEAEARKMIDEAKDYVDKAKAISLLERMKSALKKFWNWVGKDLFGIKKFSSVDEITDRVLYDLVNKTKLTEEDKEEIAKRDKLYLEAVERGDMETAQRMVNEAAAQNGYFPNSEYQGTSAYNGKAPYGNGYFLTKEERKEAYENDEFDDDTSLDDYVNSGIDPKNLGDLTNDSSYRHADDARKEAIENIRDVFQNKRQTITMYRSVPSSVKEGSFRNGDWVTPSYAYAVENARIHGWGNKFRVIKQDVPISEVWFDGNDIAEFGYGNEDDFINDKDYLYNNTKNNRKLPDAVTYDDKGKVIPLSKRFNKRKGDPRFQIVDNSQTEEERQIIETAKESGTYMKAPNGESTNLNEKQWAQVRTKAFKSWFGDWEKSARIEKLRKSEPVEITGEEIAPSDELKQYKRNALEYGKTLRGEYTNEDTKETIALTGGNSRGGIREILQHDYKDIEHLQSIAAIPQIIEKSTYIDEAPNEDVEKYPGIKSFRYYVCGLKIGNNDYTVKAVIAVQNNGDRYYDHKLSSIEKGKLLSIIPTIQEAGIEDNLPLSIGKDRRLLSILQTNSSKVVDENGEPLVIHHSTDNEFYTFSKEKLGENTDQNASDDSVAATAHIGFWFNTNDLTGTLFQERDVAGYLDVKEPYEFNSLESLVEDMSYYSSAEEFVDRLKEDGYDGIVVRKDEEMGGTSYVAFEPNQIKSATDNNGEFSQESDDIRYRESKGSSERTLVGIHNISADKLSKAIKQGGLANPSVAIIDISKQQHTGYGEISLIMPSDKINKRTGKNAGTFEGDAWTPMYPSVERQMSREGSLVMEHDIKALPNEMQLGVRNALRNWLDSRVDTKLSYLYLFQQGKAPDFETIKPKYNKEVHRAFGDIMHEVTNVYELSKNDIEKLVDLYVKTELNGDFDEFNQSYERNIAKHKEILSNKKPGSLRYEKALIYLRDAEEYGRPIDVLQRFVDEVWRDKNTQGRVSIEKTFDAANKKIKEDGLEHDYKKWTDGLNERYQTKEVIFDGFTPSGMRRYVPNTLENVSKLMKKQGRNASNGIVNPAKRNVMLR